MTNPLLNQDQTAKRAAAPSAEAEKIARKRANMAANLKSFADLAHNRAPTQGLQSFLSGPGGISNLPTLGPAPVAARKVDPLADAPERIRKLAQRHGPEAGRLLYLIAQRADEKGGSHKPVDFTTAQIAEALEITSDHAEQLLANLLQKGTLTPRTANAGGREGYVITASGL